MATRNGKRTRDNETEPSPEVEFINLIHSDVKQNEARLMGLVDELGNDFVRQPSWPYPATLLHVLCAAGASLRLIRTVHEADKEVAEKPIVFGGREYSTVHLALNAQCNVDVVRFLNDHIPQRAREECLIQYLLYYDYANVEMTRLLLEICPSGVQGAYSFGEKHMVVHEAIFRREQQHENQGDYLARNECVIRLLVASWPEVLQTQFFDGCSPLHMMVLFLDDPSGSSLVEYFIRECPASLMFDNLGSPMPYIFRHHPSLIEVSTNLFPGTLLELQDVVLTENEARSMARGLNQNLHVRRVVFTNDCFLGPLAVGSFFSTLHPDRTLDSVSINSPFDPDLFPVASTLTNLFETNRGIRRFFSTSPISDAPCLVDNTTLRELAISVSITLDLSLLLDTLATSNTTLEELSICFATTLSTLQAKEIARFLQSNPYLTTLRLMVDTFEPDSWDPILEVMRGKNVTLLEFDLIQEDGPGSYCRAQLAHYAHLNQAGRGRARESKTKLVESLDFVMQDIEDELQKQQALYGLLRDVPHLWSA
jgi:hypothetical protein